MTIVVIFTDVYVGRGVYMKVKVNKDPDKPEKFTWSKHKKWISSFADAKTIYPKSKQTKRKRNVK